MHKAILPMVCASLLTMLTACETPSDRQALLAAVPADLRNCFGEVVVPRLPPQGQPISRRQIVALVAQLRESEQARTLCGRRLLLFYDTQASVLNRREGFQLPFFR